MRSKFVSCALFALSLAACSRHAAVEKDLSNLGAPSARLVGHWATSTNDHLYFDAVDPTYKTGGYVLIHPDRKTFHHKYRIDAEDASDQHIAATLLFADGDRRDEKYVISEDGKSMTEETTITGIQTSTELRRVDDKTSP